MRLPRLFPAAALLAAACTSYLSLQGDSRYPLPVFPTATPGPSPLPAGDFGDGHDGSLTVGGAMNLVVNVCYGSVSAGGNSINGFIGTPPVGRRLLVMQVRDLFATAGPTADVTAPANAGLWEIVRVTLSSPGSAVVSPSLAYTYVTGGSRYA